MQQRVLIVTPVALFEVVDGKTVERGNCACAIVGLPSDRPKYSLVCYNERRETLCVGSLSSNNEQSIQFELQVSMYASFRDNMGKRWSFMFLKDSHIDSFLAALGIACYALSGQPANTTVISDFAPSTGELRLGLEHRVKVRYSAFAVRKNDSLLQLGELLETNGDRPYSFQPVQSFMSLHTESKGFESSVLGMMEDSRRTVVVPATLPRSGKHLYGNDCVAFVVQVVRIIHVDAPITDSSRVPTVFAEDDNNKINNNALILASQEALTSASHKMDSNGTKIVVLHSEGRESAVSGTDKFLNPMFGGEGSGIPTEHMTLIQKLGAQVNNATTSARDIRDVAIGVAGEWKQSVSRPTPSSLTDAALEASVKELIAEKQRVVEEIGRRDELLRAVDARNRELQKRLDAAALVSQQLLDERSDAARTASEARLAGDRQLLRLQEALRAAAAERDDIARHLQTVKKLLAAADDEMRAVRTNADARRLQADAIAHRNAEVREALAAARQRRTALGAKADALRDAIAAATEEAHVRAAQLNDLRRTAEAQRTQHAQLMEDERQRRGFEQHQLRDEIVVELQGREDAFRADRARVAEENFARGRAAGREIGRQEAQVDVAAQLDELRLDVQRALTELDACKTDLRRVTENAMTHNRILGTKVASLKKDMYEETRKRVRLEFQLGNTRTKVRCAQDSIMVAFTDAVRRLRMPVKPEDLLKLLDALKERRKLDFSFEEKTLAEETQAVRLRRIGWIEEEMLSLYSNSMESLYRAWVEPLMAEHQATVQIVRDLWLNRDGAAHYELNVAETRERFEIVQQMEKFFESLSNFFKNQMDQRCKLLSEAEAGFTALLEEYTELMAQLTLWSQAELQAREQLRNECIAALAAVEAEEADDFRRLMKEAFADVNAADQDAIMESEEGARATIDADQLAEYTGLLFDYNAGMTALERAAAVAAAVVKQQGDLMNLCLESRENIIAEEQDSFKVITNEYISERPVVAPPVDTKEEKEEIDRNTLNIPSLSVKKTATPVSADIASSSSSPEQQDKQPQQQEEKDKEKKQEQSEQIVSLRSNNGNDNTSEDSSDVIGPIQPVKAPPPRPKPSTKKSNLFESSSESEEDTKPVALVRKNISTRPLPPPKSKLFDSTDSDS
ncbi:uncharacterized protein TM35_000074800 [Trypanosoma theileri]|uniref:Uncharacterized protein n=1 Tax=Trypanosoma theileri TaxID=67003 RepID=A0A1X0P287_9TRYP|nr:uncharacterized protein TM35_000074800 [Trypanosoma theileri]ORC91056.1 hypothetical protein TM35_000074800 [Trypanosoma theileri]